MEIFKINNKENIVNSYGVKPTLPYDIEGVLVGKEGKDIQIEKQVDNKNVHYFLRLKEEIAANLGETVTVEKENIVSVKTEEKEEKEEKEVRKAEDIIRELGLEYTKENLRTIEYLLNNGIPITKENINSFFMSRDYLNEIIENIDYNSCIKLMDKGINLEEESLQKIAETLEAVKMEKEPFSIKRFLRLEKELTYKEAEKISKELYGQKMGKDVYDSIIALHKRKLPITKENINKVMETMNKLHDLKGLDDEVYLKVYKEDIPFNINTLFRIKNSYTLGDMDKNIIVESFEQFTITEDISMDKLIGILKELDIENNSENLSLIRQFIINGVETNKENYIKISSMKDNLIELRQLLKEEEIAQLISEGIDPLEEDIENLVKNMKKGFQEVETVDEGKIKEILDELKTLGSLKDKDLLLLIKKGEDFNLKSIKEIINTNEDTQLGINHRTLEKAVTLSHIFNTLGEELRPSTLSFAVKRYNTITLDNLYKSQLQLNSVEERITPVSKAEENLIFKEYLNARNNLTINMVKESIKDGMALEHMPLEELNQYVDKKLNKYKEGERISREVKELKGLEEKLIPVIMKNQLPMTLKELKDLNSFTHNGKQLNNLLKDMLDEKSPYYNEEVKEGIKLLQEKISSSVKNGSDSVKEEYKKLINTLVDLNNSFDSKGEKDKETYEKVEEYLSIQKKISKEDLILQLPIEIGGEYENLNLIIPNIKRGIDKNYMNFFLNLDTEKLGKVNLNLEVKGKDVFINIEEKGDNLLSNIKVFEEGLSKIGYNLAEYA
ncbi:hypothetical protein KQI42_04065 [Tissierella sp. MSJ-40]|uniref:Flagellar hook-length control protein FliK n=1 Tax=Tissierella simiarum TaxID=2841534 RepID=A0ABS6E3Z8_9FIRM|nr:DUF6240 domain-containing protein [Tissierella simiarum]MBU5437170.1 hypothetical protein [Tissierella simiarum]